jgi:hypothetical protein
MRSEVDETLRQQSERYAFRFTCEHCVHFDEARLSCAFGYPTEPHRALDLRVLRSLEFCKAFELG